MKKAIFWDFDGTLDESLRKYGHVIERAILKAFLMRVCSWYIPQKDYTDATDEKWWEKLLSNLEVFCRKNHIEQTEHAAICKTFRENVVAYEYKLYDDAEEILAYCREKGYENYLLPNNFPELVQVVRRFGLDQYFLNYFISSKIGYEKPRVEIFQYAFESAGKPEVCYMVGDNPIADIKGAGDVGLKTILVHKEAAEIVPNYRCKELRDIMKYL